MANVKLSTKAVGSIVKIKVNGAAKDFIIVHQGLPSSAYDASCNGVWVVMKDIYTTSTFGNNNSYKDSSIHSYLNSTFYNLIDSQIRAVIKQVKIPYTNSGVQSGANGLSTKVFLLSGTEVGFSGVSYMNTEGAKLSYFDSASKRVAYNGSSAAAWWLRSPYTDGSYGVWGVKSDGSFGYWFCSSTYGVRPAFVLPSSLVVSDDGTVSTNTAPAINASSTNLGEKNAPFGFGYTVTDADGDTLTVTEKLDGTTKRTYTATRKTTNSFAVTGEYFQKITNGSHTMTVTVTDGKATVTKTFTFTKAVTAASITLAKPMEADAQITLCAITVGGLIPADAVFKVEVTNNGKDSSPVWEDATTEARNGRNHLFTNQTAANGFAFNFRVTAERGASGESGYIASIQGGFQ